MQVPKSEIEKYGAAVGAADANNPRQFKIERLVEKPPAGTVDTDQAVIGRYVLPASIWPMLEQTTPGKGGEIQLTDAMARMIGQQPFHAVTFAGRRFDCGSKTGFVEATLALALEREDMGAEVRKIAERLLAG